MCVIAAVFRSWETVFENYLTVFMKLTVYHIEHLIILTVFTTRRESEMKRLWLINWPEKKQLKEKKIRSVENFIWNDKTFVIIWSLCKRCKKKMIFLCYMYCFVPPHPFSSPPPPSLHQKIRPITKRCTLDKSVRCKGILERVSLVLTIVSSSDNSWR